MTRIPRCTTSVAIIAPLFRSFRGSRESALLYALSGSLPRMLRVMCSILILALAVTFLPVTAKAQTNQSGNTTARFNKAVLVTAANEIAQVSDSVQIVY